MTDKKFPDGFLWGASTAAYQVEGGLENTDWAQAAREGKVPPAGRACDHYHRFEEDFDIAKGLGMNAQRLSVEWARIEPEEGKYDPAAIEHYRTVLRAIRARGMTPIVNMWHFTVPTWFGQRGSFLQKEYIACFARYAAHVAQELGDEATHWVTLNEPEVYALNGFFRGYWPPFGKSLLRSIRVYMALTRVHCAAYAAMKRVRPHLLIGVAKNDVYFEANRNPFNMVMAWGAKYFRDRWFLDRIAHCQDFIGLNHYFHKKYGETFAERASAVRSDMGWEVHPTSLYHCLIALKRYNVPIYVSENGIADDADSYRAQFIKNAAACVHRALSEGVDVRGYFYWSLLDNYEWAYGYTKRFGLVHVDFDTLTRTVRPSARVYADIIGRNSC